jgi:5-methylcytosine-specific restriction endonuclease McrA
MKNSVWLKFYREEARCQQNSKCCYCWEPLTATNATADHVRPQSKNGQTNRNNIKAACMACNSLKGSHSEKEYVRRIKNPQPGDGVATFVANFRYRLWHKTERVCNRINLLVS